MTDSKNISEIFTKDIINHFHKNKNEITSELLEELRKTKEGKKIALKILDLEQNEEGYYLDAFGREISYRKTPTLKSINTKLKLQPIHIEEIKKCKDDIHYFMNNYVKIKTPKGIDFPDLRHYQDEFLDCIIDDNHESIVGLLPRQSGKSVTVGIYLSHLALFEKDVNIGIAAQKHSMSKEFLTKVKDIFIELPIWLTPGVKVWNMTSISLENGVRVLADTASSDSFRGHTISFLVVDEAAYIKGRDNGMTKFSAFLDSILPSQSSLAKKKNIFISTANGMNEFHTLYKGARKNGFKKVTEILPGNKVIFSKTIEQHFNEKGNTLEEEKNIFEISVIPGDPENFKVTYNKRIPGENRSIAFETNWKNVPRWNQDGSVKEPEDFRQEIIDSKGEVFFESAYGNNFIGSSYTLIDADKLKVISPKDPIEIIDNKLKIYKKFEKGHQYICSVDPSKDGIDGFVVTFTDITSFRLEQVAVAKLQIDYLLMPEFLSEWCKIYGNPYLIIENNEGAGQSVADQMMLTYEYENLHFDKNTNVKNVVKAKKKYPGTRTTKRSRNQILKTLKTFFNNGNLIINDKDTINELYSFILIDGKYQADDGCFDDCVMSLALVFTIFNDIKNISDMSAVTEQLHQDLDAIDAVDVKELITVGSFDSEYTESSNVYTDNNGYTYEGFDETSDYSVDIDSISEFG